MSCINVSLGLGVFIACFFLPLDNANSADGFWDDFMLPSGTDAVEWNLVYSASLIVEGRLMKSDREDAMIRFTSETGDRTDISYAEFDLDVKRVVFSDLADAADTPALRKCVDGNRVKIRVLINANHVRTFPPSYKSDDASNLFILTYSPGLFCHTLVPALQSNDIEFVQRMLKLRRDKHRLLERLLVVDSE